MIKLHSSFAKKIPGAQKFSSESYLACVELELNAGASSEELKQQIHETFQLVKQSVEDEIAGSAPEESSRRQNNVEGRASNRQIEYLLDLVEARKVPLMQLNDDVHKRFGVISVYELSRRDCSRMIEEYQRAA